MSKKRKRYRLVAVLGVCVALAGWIYQSQVWELAGSTPIASQEQLRDALARGAVIVDVRMDSEVRKEGALLVPGATHISLLSLPKELDGLPRDRPIVPYCRSGGRAGHAAQMLRNHGFEAWNGGGVAELRAIVIRKIGAPSVARRAPPRAGIERPSDGPLQGDS